MKAKRLSLNLISLFVLAMVSPMALASELTLSEDIPTLPEERVSAFKGTKYPNGSVVSVANVNDDTVYINDIPYLIPVQCLPGRGKGDGNNGRSFGDGADGRKRGDDQAGRNRGDDLAGRNRGDSADGRKGGDGADGRDTGAGADGRRFGDGGDDRFGGDDDDDREFGDGGNERAGGDGADARKKGDDMDSRRGGDGADGRKKGDTADGRDTGSMADGRSFGNETNTYECNLDDEEEYVRIIGLIGHESIRVIEDSRFRSVHKATQGKDKFIRINDYYIAR